MVGVVVVLAIGVLLSWLLWEDLRGDEEPLSATVRNLGLVIGGVIAVLLALWRSRVAERQADTAQRGLLNERYQKGAEMLGSPTLSVRLGGIYALQRLAQEHPAEYHVQILRLFCAFVRNPPTRKDGEDGQEAAEETTPLIRTLREDVQAVMGAIGTRRKKHLILEGDARFTLDLHGSNLSDAILIGANLFGAILMDTNLSGARLMGALLSDALLHEADLSGAKLSLNGQNPVSGLTQSQIDKARADENNPPELDGVADVETREPLVWRDRSC